MHKDKQRDLRRGILPSTSRKGAREDLRAARRRSRAHGSEVLHEIAEVGWDDATLDPNDDFTRLTRYAVRERRDADKVAPIMRWAEDLRKKHPNADADEMYARAREVIGHSYMGDHAMTHVEMVEGFDDSEHWWRVSPEERIRRDAEYDAVRKQERIELIAKLEDLWLRGRSHEIKKLMHIVVKGEDAPDDDNWEYYPIRVQIGTETIVRVGWTNFERPIYRSDPAWVMRIGGYDRIEECVDYLCHHNGRRKFKGQFYGGYPSIASFLK
jgi:hypothetical protein